MIQFAVGGLSGWASARMMNRARLLGRLGRGLYAILVLACEMIAFGLAHALCGNGFLAVYTAGEFRADVHDTQVVGKRLAVAVEFLSQIFGDVAAGITLPTLQLCPTESRSDCVEMLAHDDNASKRYPFSIARIPTTRTPPACCPVGEWVQVDELFRYMQAQDHELEVAHDHWKLYVADSNYRSLGYGGYLGFSILECRYILVYFFEYLATLGTIDVAYVQPYGMRDDCRGFWGADDLSFFSRYDGLLYFRLNPLGAWCLDLCAEYRTAQSPEAPLLAVSEDLQIDLVRAAEPGELLMLDRYAARISEQTWLLTPNRFCARWIRVRTRGYFASSSSIVQNGRWGRQRAIFLPRSRAGGLR